MNNLNSVSQTVSKDGKTALVGFDGFIDALFRIKKETQNNQAVYFDQIKSIGEYIQQKDTSFCLELSDIETKIGGNAPILAHALGSLGVKVDLIGALGFPEINPYFKTVSENCNLYSLSEPGMAYIYEFDNGKIMLSSTNSISSINWETVKKVVGLESLIQLFESNDLYCLLNWSEIIGMTSILKGILVEVFPRLKLENKITFFDLSDFSNRSSEDIVTAVQLIKEFGKHTKVVLSLNKNEAQTLYSLFFKEEANDFFEQGKYIYKELRPDVLVLHNSKETFVFSTDLEIMESPELVEKPLISTGAGDHFNAGFCFGLLFDFDLKKCLTLANRVASHYIKTGVSPNSNDIIETI